MNVAGQNCVIRPDRGSHIPAQGRAERRSPRSAALGSGKNKNASPEGAQQALTNDTCGMNRFVSPFQGYGDCVTSAPRALPWADLFWPLRGERTWRVRLGMERSLVSDQLPLSAAKLVTDQVRARRRVGAIEAWGRGTNRVIDECKNYGIDPPTFELRGNSVVVTFRAQIALGPDLVPRRDQVGTKLGPSWDQVGTKSDLSSDQVQVLVIAQPHRSVSELMTACGRTNRTKFRNQVLDPLLEMGLIEMTMPDKPRSPKQQYRTTQAGRNVLEQEADK